MQKMPEKVLHDAEMTRLSSVEDSANNAEHFGHIHFLQLHKQYHVFSVFSYTIARESYYFVQLKKFHMTETSSLYLFAVCPVSAELKYLHGCVSVSLHCMGLCWPPHPPLPTSCSNCDCFWRWARSVYLPWLEGCVVVYYEDHPSMCPWWVMHESHKH